MIKPCLVVIDVQEKLFPVIYNQKKFLRNLEILIKGFKLFNLPIILTEQVPENLGPTIDPIRSIIEVDPIVKNTFSCVTNSQFMERINALPEYDGIVLAGIESHICVYQTGRDLTKRGYHVEVVANAIASRDKNNHLISLDRINKNGGFLTSVEMLLFDIQKKVDDEIFRNLVRLVK
ncbi:MAG: isochorismatase family protein [Candidatus Neomarinimicrobiota bacterium]